VNIILLNIRGSSFLWQQETIFHVFSRNPLLKEREKKRKCPMCFCVALLKSARCGTNWLAWTGVSGNGTLSFLLVSEEKLEPPSPPLSFTLIFFLSTNLSISSIQGACRFNIIAYQKYGFRGVITI